MLSKAEKRYLASEAFRKTPHGRKVKHDIKKKLSKVFSFIEEMRAFDKKNNLFSVEDRIDTLYKMSVKERKKYAKWVAEGIISNNIKFKYGTFMALNDYPSFEKPKNKND